jgi:predicted transcriptional regulator of viral defense system
MQKKSKLSVIEILTNLPVKVDLIQLQDCFALYRSPKKKIFDLKKKGYLRSIRRGQYFNLKSKLLEETPYEIVANSLYFPSYISMEWALQFYGLIMDRVTTVTSVTLLRSCDFKTPYAPFSYKHITKSRYPIGYISNTSKTGDYFLIARPEKALLDYVNIRSKDLIIKSEQDIKEFFENDLRLDIEEFLKITKLEDLDELLPFYHRNSKEYRILKWFIHRKEPST